MVGTISIRSSTIWLQVYKPQTILQSDNESNEITYIETSTLIGAPWLEDLSFSVRTDYNFSSKKINLPPKLGRILLS